MKAKKFGEPKLASARKSLPAGGENFYGKEGYIMDTYPHSSRKS